MALEYEQVVAAATELLKEGRNPSASAVVGRLGHGSKSTAMKYLEAWRGTLKDKGFALPSDLPKELLPAVTSFWTAATQEAASQFEADREKIEDVKRQALEDAERDRERRRESEAARERAEEALEVAHQRIVQLETSLGEQKDALTSERAALAAERTQHEQLVKEMQAEHREVVQELKSQRDVAIAERDSRIGELQNALKASDERYDRELGHWIQQLDNQRQATDRAVAQIDKEREARVSERALLERQLEVAKSQASGYENRLIEAERAIAKLEDQNERARTDQASKLDALEKRNRELESDRERLQKLLERLDRRTGSKGAKEEDGRDGASSDGSDLGTVT